MDRLLLVEDHGLLAHSLAAALRSSDADVEVVDTTMVEDLLPHLLTRAPALVLLDLDLGRHGDATSLVSPLVDAACVVVMLTGSDDPIAHARCVAAGAVGILSKAIAFNELLGEIDRVRRRGTLLDSHEREEHLRRLREHEQAQASLLAPFEQLSRREAEVLGHLLRGETVETIARQATVSIATVRTQVKAIRTKLGVGSQVAAIGRALAAGWEPPAD